jgi:hypothetical protein
MDTYKLQLKLFVDPSSTPELEAFVPVFHGFIRDKKLDGEVLVDVADYAHVHQGPGVVLIGHDCDYYTDLGGGRLGLLYNKKRGGPSDLGESLVEAFRRALRVCVLLEAEADPKARVRFGTDEALLRLTDRLRATNTANTFTALQPALEAGLARVYGEGFELMQEGSEKDPFTVRIKAKQRASASSLLERLGAPAT